MALWALILFTLFLLRLYALRLFRVFFLILLVAGPIWLWWGFAQVLAQWLHPAHVTTHTGNGVWPTSPFAMFDPLLYVNPRLISFCLMTIGLLIFGLFVSRVTMVDTRVRVWRVLWGERATHHRRQTPGDYVFSDLHLATDTVSGRPIVLDGLDRFMHMLVVGSTGAGKTSRILCKGIYQDLLAIAKGTAHDVMIIEPDGGLVEDAVALATRLGTCVTLIDLRKSAQTSACFNPFAGGHAEDVASNLRLVLQEYMGKQEAFFQTAQYSVLQTIIDVQVPIWPESNLLDFAYLLGNVRAFREVCEQVLHIVEPRYQPKRRRTEAELFYEQPAHLSMHDLGARVTRLDAREKRRVLWAVRRYLEETRTEASTEHLSKISGGLQLAIHDIAASGTLMRVLGEGGPDAFDFARFFAATTEPGRLVAVVTGNDVEGNFFGKLFLASLKQWALRRPGDEWARRPVYLWIDEFSRYTTPNIGDFFTLVRKYRIAVHVALQSRSQLKKPDTPAYLSEVEGNCRNRVYFPGLAPEDATYLEQSLGTQVKERKTVSKRAGGWLDAGRADVRVSTEAQEKPRFAVEDLLYGMKKNEAIFILMRRDQMQAPTVGRTTMAHEWLERQHLPLAPQDTGVGGRRMRLNRWAVASVFCAWLLSTWQEVSGAKACASGGLTKDSEMQFGQSVPVGTAQSEQQAFAPTKKRPHASNRMAKVVPAAKPLFVSQTKAGKKGVISNEETLSMPSHTEKASTVTEMDPITHEETEPASQLLFVDKASPLGLSRKDLRLDAQEGDKVCPSCPPGRLRLNDNRTKWQCDCCGYERSVRR